MSGGCNEVGGFLDLVVETPPLLNYDEAPLGSICTRFGQIAGTRLSVWPVKNDHLPHEQPLKTETYRNGLKHIPVLALLFLVLSTAVEWIRFLWHGLKSRGHLDCPNQGRASAFGHIVPARSSSAWQGGRNRGYMSASRRGSWGYHRSRRACAQRSRRVA